jgi:hypothetical protein
VFDLGVDEQLVLVGIVLLNMYGMMGVIWNCGNGCYGGRNCMNE